MTHVRQKFADHKPGKSQLTFHEGLTKHSAKRCFLGDTLEEKRRLSHRPPQSHNFTITLDLNVTETNRLASTCYCSELLAVSQFALAHEGFDVELIRVRNVLLIQGAPLGHLKKTFVSVAVETAEGRVDNFVPQIERVHQVHRLRSHGGKLDLQAAIDFQRVGLRQTRELGEQKKRIT